MPAQADIIVSSPDATEVKLVVEARLKLPNLPDTEHQLREFMLQMRCPIGLLVSPSTLRVYVDRFTSYSQDSIERLGEFDVEGLIALGPSDITSAVAFENAVQRWLEDLANRSTRSHVKDAKFREAIDHYILPAVESGVVRAGGPR